MKSDELKAIEEELARQDEALAKFRETLASLGDVELQIDAGFFRDLEEACAVRTTASTVPMIFGLKA